MPGNIANKDVKTLGLILRRTNYGEADRILNVITPVGKISAIAKGVRKAKSKLAGGVEMFTLSELQIHQGRSEMGVVTSAKMVKYYKGILEDFTRIEFAGMVLKQISKVAEHTDSSEWFEVTKQVMEALDEGMDMRLVESWFWLNLLKMTGEEMNLYRDMESDRLKANRRYDWDAYENSFVKNDRGEYGADEIKLLRLMVTSKLSLLKRIKLTEELQGRVFDLVQIMTKN